jgi:hypothetical protein
VPADGSITSAKLAGSLSVGLAAGSASTPSLFFTGDLNTGIYSPGADQVAITTNGVERVEWGTSEVVFNDGGTNYDFRIEGDTNANLFFVDASADAVGLGTSSPGAKLHSIGGTTSGGVDTAAIFTGGVLNAIGSGARIVLSGTPGFETTRGTYIEGVFDTGTNAHSLRFGTSASGADPTERARIDSSGRLLVGTSTARSTIGFDNTPQLQVEGTNANTASISIVSNANNAGAPVLFLAKSRGGSVGSNTAVQSGDGLGLIQWSGNDGSQFEVAASIACEIDGTPAQSSGDMPGRLVFSTTADGASSPTERMRIHQNGYVSFNGTNTTTSNGGVGAVYKFFGADGNVTLPFESTGTNKNVLLEYRRTGRSNARTSQIQIGENPSNQGIVYVYSSAANADISGGVALENGATSWASISDIRLKNIVSTFDSALSDVSTLEAFRFTWKNDASAAPQVGLSAQSVQAVLPEAVSSGKPINASEDDDAEYLSVRYTEVIPLLVAALQESKQRIETLEAKVAAFEAV